MIPKILVSLRFIQPDDGVESLHLHVRLLLDSLGTFRQPLAWKVASLIRRQDPFGMKASSPSSGRTSRDARMTSSSRVPSARDQLAPALRLFVRISARTIA